jgi:UDP-N-acetylmuramoyl-L-alanyl-D-glutamate--2,6-diaminopimelate ligase
MIGIKAAGGQKLQAGDSGYLMVLDRADAIRKALEMATPDDGVLIAGKGHEEYQIIGTEVLAFSDQETVKETLEAMYGDRV